MKTNIKFWFVVIMATILIGVVLTIGIRIGKKSVATVSTVYVTDTVWLDKPYILPIPPKGFKYTVKPAIVTYQKPASALEGELSRINDSLSMVITKYKGRADTVYVSGKFLTFYPGNPKLLSLYLRYDSLWITLFNTKAQVYTLHYPLDIQNNEYFFSDNNLTSKSFSIPRLKVPLKPSLSIYAGMGIPFGDVIYPILSVQYTQPIRPVQLQLEPQMTITDKPHYSIIAKAGFKIF